MGTWVSAQKGAGARAAASEVLPKIAQFATDEPASCGGSAG